MASEPDKFEKQTIAALFSDSKDSEILLSLLDGKKLKTNAEIREAKRVAELFVQRVLAGERLESLYLNNNYNQYMAKALQFSGMNDKGSVFVDDQSLRDQVFDKFLPVTFGEEGNPLFSNEVNEALFDYLKLDGEVGFSDYASEKVNSFLDKERKVILLNRAADKLISQDIDVSELTKLYEKNDIIVPDLKNDESLPLKNSDKDVSALGDESQERDYAAIKEEAIKGNLRYQLEVERRTEALLSLNELMRKQPDWVNRTVVDKLKTKAKNAFDSALGQNTMASPSESIFGETLSQIDDATGRVVNEMVRYNNSMGGFKATFKDPQVPKEAYLATAHRLAVEGVQNPYIKATFRNPDLAREFLHQMVDSLVEAGYDIEDIRVAPNLRDQFHELKINKYPTFSVSESPEPVVDNPDFESESPESELTKGEQQKLKDNERFGQRFEGADDAIALSQRLKEVNEPIHEMHKKMTEGNMKLSDIDNSLTYEVLARANLLTEFDSTTWEKAISEEGVLPHVLETLRGVRKEFSGYLKTVLGNMNGDEKELGERQLERLLGAKDVLYGITPIEKHASLDKIFDHLDSAPLKNKNGPEQNGPEQNGPEQNGPEQNGPEQNGPEQNGPEQNGPEQNGPKQNGPVDSNLINNRGQQEPVAPNGASQEQVPPHHLDNPPLMTESEMALMRGGYSEEGFEQVRDFENYERIDPSELSNIPPQEQENIPSPSELQINEGQKTEEKPVYEEIEDVKQEPYVFDEDKWRVLLGKNLSELTPDSIKNILDITPKESLYINSATPTETMDFDDIEEIKNTINTVKIVLQPYQGDASNFGDVEWDFVNSLPEDLVPDWLEPILKERKESLPPELPKENEEPKVKDDRNSFRMR